jgi:hypothetical protein
VLGLRGDRGKTALVIYLDLGFYSLILWLWFWSGFVLEVSSMFGSDWAQWVICFMSCTTGSILEWRVGTSSTSIVGRDSAGVVLCSILLGTDSTYWLVSLAESGVMAIFLAVAAFGRGIPGKVFLDVAEVIANSKGGSAEVLIIDHAN